MLGMRLSADAHAIKIASSLHKYLVAPAWLILLPLRYYRAKRNKPEGLH